MSVLIRKKLSSLAWICLALTTSSSWAGSSKSVTLYDAGDFNQPVTTNVQTQPEQPAKPESQPPYDPNQTLEISDLFKVSFRASPQVLQSEVAIERARAQQQQLQAQDSFQLNLEGRYTWREYQNKPQENPRLVLHGSKKLYDFGRLDKLQQASEIAQQAGEQLRWQQQARYRLRLLKAYFDVLLVDMRYRVLNEKMAVVYVGLDKARDLHREGEISDVDLAKKAHEYQQALTQRAQAELAQRQKRLVLANLLGFPDAIPDQLQIPNISTLQKAIKQLPELDRVVQLGLQRSPELLFLQKQVAVQQAQVSAAKYQNYPEVVAEAWVGYLSGHPDKYEGHWRFDIGFKAPLYDAGLNSGQVAAARANLHQAVAQLQAKEQQLRDTLAELYFQLKLSQTQLKQNQAFGDYADLYLDYSRGRYEWEEKTDLGDAMVRLSEADYQRLQTQLQMALNWTNLIVQLGFEPSPEWVTPEMQQVLTQNRKK